MNLKGTLEIAKLGSKSKKSLTRVPSLYSRLLTKRFTDIPDLEKASHMWAICVACALVLGKRTFAIYASVLIGISFIVCYQQNKATLIQNRLLYVLIWWLEDCDTPNRSLFKINNTFWMSIPRSKGWSLTHLKY